MADKRIDELAVLNANDVTTPADILFPCDDVQAATEVTKQASLTVLARLIGQTPQITTAADADATPTVDDTDVLRTANTGATTITDFDDGVDGQMLIVHVNDANTTIANNANIALTAGTNFVAAVEDVLLFILDSTVWREIGGTSLDLFIHRITGDGSLGATPTVDWSQTAKHTGVLNANITTLTFTDPPTGMEVLWILSQDATGGRTIDWSNVSLNGSDPVVSTTASTITIVRLMFNGTEYHVIP